MNRDHPPSSDTDLSYNPYVRCLNCCNWGIQTLTGIGAWTYNTPNGEVTLRAIIPRKICVRCEAEYEDQVTLDAIEAIRRATVDDYMTKGRQ